MAGVTGTAGWPIESDQAGVHPSQRKEAYEESVRLGVPTQFDSKGCAIFTDRQHQKQWLKAMKWHNKGDI